MQMKYEMCVEWSRLVHDRDYQGTALSMFLITWAFLN